MFKFSVSLRSGGADGTHQSGKFIRVVQLGVVGELDGGTVLTGKQRTRVNRLALAEQERMLLAAGLGRSQPLEARRSGTGLVIDREDDSVGDN